MPTAFFEPTDSPGRFVALPQCSSPWSDQLCHGGPPAALLTKELEQLESSLNAPGRICRVTLEILGPVPVGEVTVTSRVARAGRTVELLEAQLSAQGRPAMLTRAWRMRTQPQELPIQGGLCPLPEGVPGFPAGPVTPPSFPASADEPTLAMWTVGYSAAIEWRFVVGGEHGGTPAVVWARPMTPIVAGGVDSPLSRVMLLADTGNGLSRVLDINTWWFINTELTVHLQRAPLGDWFALAARTTIEPTGTGLTETELFDRTGRIGRSAQALLVGRR